MRIFFEFFFSGSFGFLAFKEENRITCNQGLGDQQLALQWVQDHIEVFGGDKNRVSFNTNFSF